MSIVDLKAEREKRDGPEPDCIRSDGYGRKLFRFGLTYQMDSAEALNGGRWSIDLWAYSREDAEARCAAMRETLEVGGQIIARIPA